MPDTNPIQALINAIRDGNSEGIETAVDLVISRELQETSVTQLAPILLSPTETDSVRRQTVLALNQIEYLTAVPILGEALESDKTSSVRRLCIASLEKLSPRLSIPYFQTALQDSEPDICESALVSLGIGIRENMILWQNSDETEQSLLKSELDEVHLDNLDRLLRLEFATQDTETTISIPEAAASALRIVGEIEAIPYLCKYLKEEQEIQAHFDGLSTEELEELDQEHMQRLDQDKDHVMMSVIQALREIGEPEVVPCIGDTLNNSLNFRVRRLAASALGRLGYEHGIGYLMRAFLIDNASQVRQIAGTALFHNPFWREKVRQVSLILTEGTQQRSQIDAMAVVTALKPPEDELNVDEHLLTDYLIVHGVQYGNDKRMVAIFAALVIASANSSMILAAERIDACQENTQISAEQLQPLRIEIGGVKALTPLLSQLEKNLNTYFQEPIKELNENSSKVWQQTIRIAQIGFAVRSTMSVVLFGIGAYLVLDSYRQFVAGNLPLEQYLGPGISFVGGLGTMLAMIFTGPLKEIRKSVSDVGMASAIFIAYIHRVLQESHTFSYYYLQGRITFEELDTASKLIKESLQDTLDALKLPD